MHDAAVSLLGSKYVGLCAEKNRSKLNTLIFIENVTIPPKKDATDNTLAHSPSLAHSHSSSHSSIIHTHMEKHPTTHMGLVLVNHGIRGIGQPTPALT